jgi:hypothetical protein
MSDEVPLLLTVRAAARFSGVTVEQAYELTRTGQWGGVLRLGSRRQLVARENVRLWCERFTSSELHIEEAQ